MKKSFLIMMTMSLTSLIASLMMMEKSWFIMMEYPLMNNSQSTMSINMMMDWTSMTFTSTVMMITSMIAMFSKSYINNLEMPRFIPLMLMFMLSMILLIMSNNLLTMIIGWDGLGISSYILVAYYQNFSTAASSTLTILSNRVGDIAIISSMAMLMPSTLSSQMNTPLPKTPLIILMMAALTKSAQFPFSSWLPAAMAAPTPISALVHSSTLVTAGVYLMIRLNTQMHPTTCLILTITTSFTTMMASITANWQQDMKKIIALSTLSQIAIMMFSISINANKAAFFHLITHALFKSTMFMCAGVMINLSSYQDLRSSQMPMTMPITTTTFGLSSMALMGLPFMSGFYSKDLIIETSMTKTNMITLSMMVMSLGLTSSYSIRMLKKTMKYALDQKPDINKQNTQFSLPLMIMNPTSIMTGAMLTWMTLPEQMILMPETSKTNMTIMLLLGLMMGTTLSFNTQKYMKKSEFSTSLWFNHTTTCHLMKKSDFLTKTFKTNDTSWLELMGPKGIKMSNYTNTNKMMLMSNTLSSMTIIIIMSSLMLT